MGCSGVHIEDVTCGQRAFGAGTEVHVDVRKLGEIVGGTVRESWLDLVGVYGPCVSYQLREQRCVVAGAGADVDDPFALLRSQGSDADGVQCGLSIVERAFATERDDDILI
jgi:hypothetical protein